MRTDFFGTMYDTPIVFSPTASNMFFHPEGEVAVAKAAKAGNHLHMLSTVATTPIEDAIAARGAPVWFQLLPTQKWEVPKPWSNARARRQPGDRGHPRCVARQNWETLFRLMREDTANVGLVTCRTLQTRRPQTQLRWDRPRSASASAHPNLDWEFVQAASRHDQDEIVLKGILASRGREAGRAKTA